MNESKGETKSLITFGQSIMKCKPFVCALKATQKSFRCDFCFKSVENESIECNDCHKYWYCSHLCRKSDSITHMFECNEDNDLRQLIADKCRAPAVQEESDWCKFRDCDEFVTQTLLLLRILFKLKSDPESRTQKVKLIDGRFVSYDDIPAPKCQQMHKVWDERIDSEGVKTELIDEVSYNFGAWLSVVSSLLKSEFIESRLGSVADEELKRAFRIVVRNTLYVCDTAFLNEIGKAIYVEMCFVSHSCVPNCGPLFDGTNTLDLRPYDERFNFDTTLSELRYDYQIEMTGFSAQELIDSLFVRNIQCQCKKCSNPKLFAINLHKNLTNANLKYGNWPKHDYCQAMTAPIDEALDSYVKTYGRYHPWITALLLWKLRVELVLFRSEESDDITRDQLFDTFKRLKDCLCVTHGSHHHWYHKLCSIDKVFVTESDDCLQFIENTCEQILPLIVIDQKIS